MLNLQQFLEHIEIRGMGRISALSATNIDDVFNTLKQIGVEEVKVNMAQMSSILYFMFFTSEFNEWQEREEQRKALIQVIQAIKYYLRISSDEYKAM